MMLTMSVSMEVLRSLNIITGESGLLYVMIFGAGGMVSTFAVGLGVHTSNARKETARLLMEQQEKRLKAEKAQHTNPSPVWPLSHGLLFQQKFWVTYTFSSAVTTTPIPSIS